MQTDFSSCVNVHTANWKDVSACAGDSTRIKAVPVAGLSGTSYSWSPSGGLGCTSCPQPNSLVITTTTYTLTQTINKSGEEHVLLQMKWMWFR